MINLNTKELKELPLKKLEKVEQEYYEEWNYVNTLLKLKRLEEKGK